MSGTKVLKFKFGFTNGFVIYFYVAWVVKLKRIMCKNACSLSSSVTKSLCFLGVVYISAIRVNQSKTKTRPKSLSISNNMLDINIKLKINFVILSSAKIYYLKHQSI
jgi:hypothetical protein